MPVFEAPVRLSTGFPLAVSDPHCQGDTPIAYLHGHDCLEIGCCHRGAGIFSVGDKVLPFRAGDITVIPPSEFHLAQSMAGTVSEWDWIYVDPVRLLQLPLQELAVFDIRRFSGAGFPNVISRSQDAFLFGIVCELVRELRSRKTGYKDVARGIVWCLMGRLQRLVPASHQPYGSQKDAALQRVAPALSLMSGSYADAITPDELARHCHMSETNFRRVFHRALGRSPHRYLMEVRVRVAASRLQATNDKIVTIAQDAGFVTLSSFNRAFRTFMGMAPKDWRARGKR